MEHFRLAQNDTEHDSGPPSTIAGVATLLYYDKFRTIGDKPQYTIKPYYAN